MKIVIETIPHSQQRYETVGDWFFEQTKNCGLILHIKVSSMQNADMEILVAIHELIEAILCSKRGITQQVVDAFDESFEFVREKGDDSEPGDSPDAPYRKEHLFTTGIEKLMAAELDVDWQAYEKAVNELCQ